MLGLDSFAKLGRTTGGAVAAVVAPIINRSWRAKMTTIESKLADARNELASLEERRRALAVAVEDDEEGAGKRLDAVVRDVEKARRRVDDLEAAKAGVEARLDQERAEEEAARRQEWEQALAEKVDKVNQAARRVDETIDALAAAADDFLDNVDALRAHLPKGAKALLADRIATLSLIIADRLDRRFGLQRAPFGPTNPRFAEQVNVSFVAALARYAPPADKD